MVPAGGFLPEGLHAAVHRTTAMSQEALWRGAGLDPLCAKEEDQVQQGDVAPVRTRVGWAREEFKAGSPHREADHLCLAQSHLYRPLSS